MNLDAQQRLNLARVFDEAASAVERGYYSGGCNALVWASSRYAMSRTQALNLFHDRHHHPMPDDPSYWWPRTPEGNIQRIAALKECAAYLRSLTP